MLWLAINLIHLLLRCGLRLLTEEICQISDWGPPNSPKHLRGNLAAVQVSFTHGNLLFLSAFPICRPTRTRTQTNSFGDCYATITSSTYYICGKAGFRPQSGLRRTIWLAVSLVSSTIALSKTLFLYRFSNPAHWPCCNLRYDSSPLVFHSLDTTTAV